MKATLSEIARLVKGEVVGNPGVVVTGLAGLRDATPQSLTFVSQPSYLPQLGETRAAAAVVGLDVVSDKLPLVRVKDADEAICLAKEVELRRRHTAVIHSRNIERLSAMARLMDCSLFVKNGPACAGLGAGGEGHASFTIASPTGEGLTSARSFTRRSRCVLVDYFRIV